MRMTRIWCYLAVSGIALGAPGTKLAAQAAAIATRIEYTDRTLGHVTLCGNNLTQFAAALFFSYGCAGHGVSGSALGGSFAGTVMAAASVDVPTPRFIDGSVTSFTFANWTDRIMLRNSPMPVRPTYAVFDIAVSGLVHSGLSAGVLNDQTDASGAWGFNASKRGGPTILSDGQSFTTTTAAPVGLTPLNVSVPIIALRSYIVPFDSFGEIQFSYSLSVGASIRSLWGNIVGSASSDMSHTMYLTGLSFLDDKQRKINSYVDYSFENGTEIVDVSIVPEPSTVLLSWCGLLALFSAHRRIRVKTKMIGD